jgi:outer membrane protein TolC
MNRIYSTVLMILVVTISAVGQEITLAEYLQRVQENHPFFKKELLKVAIEERDAESYLGGQEWFFSLSPSYSHLGDASASEIGAEGVDQATVVAGLSRLFWSTGGSVSFSVSSGYTNSRGTPLGDTEAYSQGVSLAYVQPLLKNRGGELYRLGYEVSRFNAVRVRIEIEEAQESFLLGKALMFLDWALVAEQIRIAKQRLELSREQLGQIQRRFEANLVDRVDVLRGDDAVRSAEQALIQLQSQWKAKQTELAVLAADQSIYEAAPSFGLYALGELPDVEADASALAAGARVLRPLEVVLEQLARRCRGLEEELRSDLSLSVAAGLKSSEEKIVDSLDILNPDFNVALEYSVPSGNVAVRAKIEKVEAQSRQIREEMRSIVVELESALRGLFVQIRDMEKILELGSEQIESAGERTAEELKLYNQGRGQLTFVIQARDNEQNARLAQANNAALYHSLLLQYKALMDELLPAATE